MTTTITSQIFYQNFLYGLQQNLQAELTDSNQISSTKQISTPSDDPSTLWKVVDYQTQISQIGQYQQSISAAKVPLQSIDSSLTTLNSTLSRANELAVSAGDGSLDTTARSMISDEIQQLFNSALSTANTQINGRYIFAGYQSDVNPIDPNTGEFVSDGNSFNMNIADGVNISTNVSAGSLFSFRRVNSTDAATNILPSYNWSNGGANTIPDADPTSALETTVPTTPIYTINAGDSISIGGVKYDLTAGAGSYNKNNFVSQLNYLTNPAVTGVTFSYDATNNKFQIVNNSGAAVSVNWGSTTLNIEKALGYDSAGDQTVGAWAGVGPKPSIGSDNTVGKYTASNDIFTQNGGAFNIKVGSATTQSGSAFVINNTNNAIVITDGSGTNTYYIKPGVYTGSGLADAISNYLSTSPTGSPYVPSQLVKASYDNSVHKFNITAAGSTTAVNFGSTSASGTTTMDQMLGFNDSDTGTIGAGITSDYTAGDVNLAANSTLQDVRDAFNAASAGVKAEIVNQGTTANPDFRVVVASDPAGNSANIDISILSDPTTTTPRTTSTSIPAGGSITGAALALPQVITAGVNDKISFTDPANSPNLITATIPAGTYTTGNGAGSLAQAIQTALNTADAAAFPAASVTATGAGLNQININSSSTGAVTIDWTNANTTVTPQQLGYGASAIADSLGTGIYMLSYDKSTAAVNMTLGTNITNYNNITQASANDSIVIDDGTTANGVANNHISVNVGGVPETVNIARGTYTHDQLAVAVTNALNAAATAAGKTDTYTVAFDPNANKFTIAGNAGNADVLTLDWSNAGSTARQLLGYSPTDQSPAIAVSAGNNTIGFSIGANNYTATVASGVYTSGAAFAAAIKTALNKVPSTPAGSTVTDFDVQYDTNTNNFSISTKAGDPQVTVKWGSGLINEAQLGFSGATTVVNAGGGAGTATSTSSVSLDGKSDNSVLANYYSFNNNYLNDKYVLRALNFENQSLKNNDSGRIGQSLQYMTDLTSIVSQTQASVGARENQLTAEATYQTNSSTNIQTFLSEADDTDFAKVASDLTQRQTALQALRTISGQILNQSLFDFVKF